MAQELLKSCEQLTKSWGYPDLFLHVMGDNERGRNLYEKLGYELVSSEVVWSIIPWHRPERLFLRKQLEPIVDLGYYSADKAPLTVDLLDVGD